MAFSAPCSSVTLELIYVKFDTIDYVYQATHTPKLMAAKKGCGKGEVVTIHIFSHM